MTKTLAAFLAAVLLAGLAPNAPVEARNAKAKAYRGDKVVIAKRVPRTAPRMNRSDTYEPIRGQPGMRDNTTYLLPNGRINGQEFFEQMNDLAGDIGD